ncbi:hypothetical protein Vadar_026672 [Vaccinium darrowii]|uniref:Uncharacterized protein n=1 Tax=Vaccinium darrowii TaxID=229202 RepID=A0ACB7YIC5_9ERIC|nr:hypothetical protein Vadar_026672 [Vaccinium darrowii]
MVETRSNNFVLGLVVIFLALKDSLAHTHKGQEEMLMVVKGGNAFLASGVSPSTFEKENFDGMRNAAGGNNGKLGGRKMMEKAEEGMKGLIAPTNSGANCFVGNCKLGATSTSTTTVKVEREGFMAFSADYNVPRPHPPKNN